MEALGWRTRDIGAGGAALGWRQQGGGFRQQPRNHSLELVMKAAHQRNNFQHDPPTGSISQQSPEVAVMGNARSRRHSIGVNAERSVNGTRQDADRLHQIGRGRAHCNGRRHPGALDPAGRERRDGRASGGVSALRAAGATDLRGSRRRRQYTPWQTLTGLSGTLRQAGEAGGSKREVELGT